MGPKAKKGVGKKWKSVKGRLQGFGIYFIKTEKWQSILYRVWCKKLYAKIEPYGLKNEWPYHIPPVMKKPPLETGKISRTEFHNISKTVFRKNQKNCQD